ncbi:hypothetical protein LT493_19385 [Streptomyces tricolor]|nr:hypothetical protein [Streptomyces tricolor]
MTVDKAQTWLRAEYDAQAGVWKDLSRSHQEIGAEVEQLLGMSREQFPPGRPAAPGRFALACAPTPRPAAGSSGRLLRVVPAPPIVEKRLAERRRAAEARAGEGDTPLLADAHPMQQEAGDAMELPGAGPRRPGPARAGSSAPPAVARSTRTGTPHRRPLPALRRRSPAHAAARRSLEEARNSPGCRAVPPRLGSARERLQERAVAHREAQQRMERGPQGGGTSPPRWSCGRPPRREHRRAAAAALRHTRAHCSPPPRRRRRERDSAAAARRAAEELGGLDAARRAERRLAELAAERAGLDRQERANDDVLREADAWLAD